jgi:HSP20 family protein
MMRWDPWREMMGLRNAMDRLFDESFIRAPRSWTGDEGAWDFALDMYQTDNDVVVKANVPGMDPEEVDITITGDTVTIRGEHKEEQETKDQDYFRKEIRYGNFNRSVTMPVPVKSDKAEATFENGILTLTLPKAEEAKPKQIKVKAKKMIEGGKK